MAVLNMTVVVRPAAAELQFGNPELLLRFQDAAGGILKAQQQLRVAELQLRRRRPDNDSHIQHRHCE